MTIAASCLLGAAAVVMPARAWHETGDVVATETLFAYYDAAYDALAGQQAADIVSVTYEAKPHGATGKLHVVVTMELAAPPSDLVDYQTGVQTARCGDFDTAYGPPAVFTTMPGTSRSNVYVGCGGRDDPTTGFHGIVFPRDPKVDGTRITWALPYDQLPAEMRGGPWMQHFYAFTQYAEPLYGHNGSGNVGQGLDAVRTSIGWRLPPG